MNAPRICVAGAGAVGSVLAAHLAMAGHSVSILARGERRAALARSGLRYSAPGEPEVRLDIPVGNASELGVQDIVFTAVKAQALPALVDDIQKLSGKCTVIVPLVNGIPWWFFHGGAHAEAANRPRVQSVDPVGALAAGIAPQNIVGAVVYLTATLDADGVAHSHKHRRLELGDVDELLRERTHGLASMLSEAGIEARAVPDIRERLLTKVALNLSTNPLSVVTGATLSEMFEDALLQPLILAVAAEVRTMAAGYGLTLTMDDAQMIATGRAAGPFKTSMLQDFERGAPLELAAIADACVELGHRKGIAMPLSTAIASLAAYNQGAAELRGIAA